MPENLRYKPSLDDRHRLMAASNLTAATPRYRAGPTPPTSVDALLGFDTPAAPTPTPTPKPTPGPAPNPDGWVGFGAQAPASGDALDALDAWAQAYGLAPPTPTPTPAPVPPIATPTPTAPIPTPKPGPTLAPIAAAPTLPAAEPLSTPAQPWAAACRYPQVGGGFDCSREGTRIILPPIRWPLLPPLEPWPPRAPTVLPFAAPATPAAKPPPPPPLPDCATPAVPAPAWRHPDYRVPPFTLARGESTRATREFPVLQSRDPLRQVWHYCAVMAQQGVFAGHFEVHALSRADIGRDGQQRRIIVYSRGAHTPPGSYQLAMDTHADGPKEQPRIFLLHDAQANHYRFLATHDTTQPRDWLRAQQAQPIESGGGGDCLFYSVARGLGYGAQHRGAATYLRRVATAYLYHHPEESLNGDTLALFVNKLGA